MVGGIGLTGGIPPSYGYGDERQKVEADLKIIIAFLEKSPRTAEDMEKFSKAIQDLYATGNPFLARGAEQIGMMVLNWPSRDYQLTAADWQEVGQNINDMAGAIGVPIPFVPPDVPS